MTLMHTARWLAALSLAAGLSVAAPAHAHEAAAPSSGTVLRGLDLDRATVLDMQRAMDRGRFDSVTLTRFYLDRIRSVDPLLHAVIATNPEALREARQSDQRRAAGRTARWKASRSCSRTTSTPPEDSVRPRARWPCSALARPVTPSWSSGCAGPVR